jgi:hypothetical protein
MHTDRITTAARGHAASRIKRGPIDGNSAAGLVMHIPVVPAPGWPGDAHRPHHHGARGRA